MDSEEAIVMETSDFVRELKRAIKKMQTEFYYRGERFDGNGKLWAEGSAYQKIELFAFTILYVEPFRVRVSEFGRIIQNFPDESKIVIRPKVVVYELLEDGTHFVLDKSELDDTILACGIGNIDYELLN